ncbi:histamine H2 receptor-like [Uloborus diversus]|uniref:histamine H2 receptor-like n=1 Tax=Uloborus diversus TaxID=327109 RepID=UPI0024098940|nr:histamine H2 receptor-like [Uloborus diversus]
MENVTLFLVHFNDTIPADFKRPLSVRIIGSSFTFLVGLASIIGNLAVIFVSYSDETLRNQASNFFIVFLSITDVTTGIFTIIPSAVSVAFDYWPFGGILCRLQNGMGYTCSCNSILIIGLITLDRTIAVLNPLKHHRIMNASRVLSLCLSLAVFSVLSLIVAFCTDWTQYNYAEAQCGFDWRIYEVRIFAVPGTVLCFCIPAVLLGICNALIISTAMKWNKKKQFLRHVNAEDPEKKANDDKMKKTIVTAFVLVGTFYLCVTPFVTSKNVHLLFGLDPHPLINYLFSVLVYVSSAVNPFIYAILRKDFTNAFKKIPRQLSEKFSGLNEIVEFQ